MLFLSPHILPYLLDSQLPNLDLSKTIKRIGEDAKKVAPTGKAVEAVENTERTSLRILSLLKKGSIVFGTLLVLVGLLV